jgi:hypothetical protein
MTSKTVLKLTGKAIQNHPGRPVAASDEAALTHC